MKFALNAALDVAEKAADEAGLAQDVYVRAILDSVLPEICSPLESLSDTDPETVKQYMGVWSEVDEFTRRMAGYRGLCAAMCEGDDLFSLEDTQDCTGDGSWPTGYFFDGILPEGSGVDTFRVCTTYLEGYGMDDPILCALGREDPDSQQALDCIAGLKAAGCYTFYQRQEDDTLLWMGCRTMDDGSCAFFLVDWAPAGQGSMAQTLSGGHSLSLLMGNFDFVLCLESAITVYYG